MTKVIDNSWTEDVSYQAHYSPNRSIRWAGSANNVKAYIGALGISEDYNIRASMVVSGVGNTLTLTPTGDFADTAYFWASVTDGEGHFQHGQSADPTAEDACELDTTGFNYQKPWIVTIRARKVGDTQDAVIVWMIDNPSEDPTVAIPAGYYN